MMLFKLKCAAEHEFDGWFRDNAAYDRQRVRGQIACPTCGSAAVEKALMAPRLGRSRPEPVAAAPAPRSDKPAGEAPSPAMLRQALQELRRHVESHCDYVGERFADEARRIHRGDAEARGIYGEASDSEASALADEGIEVARIPWVPPNDA
jgi:hypothetical protein